MKQSLHLRQPLRVPVLCLAVAIATAAFVGCEQRSTTVQTPSGSVTTTTVGPTPAVRQELSEAAASASAALSRAGPAASRVLDQAQAAAADAAITARVKAALLVDTRVKGMQIDVDTHERAVTLTGNAEARPGLDTAVEIARGVDGVKSVEIRSGAK